jgi:hypothetical protein
MNDFAFSDERAVRDTLALYCHRCDDGDIAGVVALFTPEGAFTFNGRTTRGSGPLYAFFRAAQGRPEQRGKHLTVNSVIEVIEVIEGVEVVEGLEGLEVADVTDGTDVADSGEGQVRVVSDFVFLLPAKDRLVATMAGRYHDRFVKLDGRWRIARRDVVLTPRAA